MFQNWLIFKKCDFTIFKVKKILYGILNWWIMEIMTIFLLSLIINPQMKEKSIFKTNITNNV